MSEIRCLGCTNVADGWIEHERHRRRAIHEDVGEVFNSEVDVPATTTETPITIEQVFDGEGDTPVLFVDDDESVFFVTDNWLNHSRPYHHTTPDCQQLAQATAVVPVTETEIETLNDESQRCRRCSRGYLHPRA